MFANYTATLHNLFCFFLDIRLPGTKPGRKLNLMGKKIAMKLAVITEDLKTISAHFWRAQHYLVFTVENGRIAGQEIRSMANDFRLLSQKPDLTPLGPNEMDPKLEEKFTSRMGTIIDCDVLLTRGMDRATYDGLRIRSIQPIITTIRDVGRAVEAYRTGRIIDHPERLC